jgi:hypothetical protein
MKTGSSRVHGCPTPFFLEKIHTLTIRRVEILKTCVVILHVFFFFFFFFYYFDFIFSKKITQKTVHHLTEVNRVPYDTRTRTSRIQS